MPTTENPRSWTRLKTIGLYCVLQNADRISTAVLMEAASHPLYCATEFQTASIFPTNLFVVSTRISQIWITEGLNEWINVDLNQQTLCFSIWASEMFQLLCTTVYLNCLLTCQISFINFSINVSFNCIRYLVIEAWKHDVTNCNHRVLSQD